jgi:hypothetical protein
VTCYATLDAARPTGSNIKPLIYAKGQRPDPLAKGWEPLQLPCGRCIGCRLEHSRINAARIMHESKSHQLNTFVTLTYDEEHCPTDFSLVPDHMQKFWKRLRRAHEPQQLRYFYCGEYGENFERPHYHACMFGIDFHDKKLWTRENDNDLYESATLDKIWGKGKCIIGELTFESAAYVGRYVTKKITGKNAFEHYWRTDPRTGLEHQIEPEYAQASRRPGIGRTYYETYNQEIYDWDEIIVRGHPCKPPRYYDKLHDQQAPEIMQRIRLQRELAAKDRAHDCTPHRLWQREQVKLAQSAMLKRGFENDT